MNEVSSIETEAVVFCKYLTGGSLLPRNRKIYMAAIRRERSVPSTTDTAVLEFAVRRPWSLPYLDGALALVRPQSLLRRRLYTMFAITEASPEYADRFLPVARGKWYLLVVGLAGVRAVFRAVVGLVLMRLIKGRSTARLARPQLLKERA